MHSKHRVAILNSMADPDFSRSLARQQTWHITDLDLKDSIFGKAIVDLTPAETHTAAEMIARHGMQTYCLSTVLFYDDTGKGESQFAADNLRRIPAVLAVAKILRPRFIRLLPAKIDRQNQPGNSLDWVRKTAPWLLTQYRQAVAEIHAAGFEATIENEAHNCILGSTSEILEFFTLLGNCGASFTWDIQNLWQHGTYPSVEVYNRLKPLIRYVHVKGGIQDAKTGALELTSTLADATWPVKEIVRTVMRDQLSPVICINPSHGKHNPNYTCATGTPLDVAWLQAQLA